MTIFVAEGRAMDIKEVAMRTGGPGTEPGRIAQPAGRRKPEAGTDRKP